MVSHPIALRGLFPVHGEGPSILQRTDSAFIPGVLKELAADDELQRLGSTLADRRDEDRILKLQQPVQRTFNVTVVEGFCDTFGLPPIAASQITGQGVVLRRQSRDAKGNLCYEAWCSAGPSLRGWIPLTAAEEDADPDPELRPPALNGGHPEINRRLAMLHDVSEPLAESVSPLFPAPPEVCKQLHRTVLYGLVPVTSTEISEVPEPGQAAAYSSPATRQALQAHLLGYLRHGNFLRPVPQPGSFLTFDQVDRIDQLSDGAEKTARSEFMLFLRQVAIELDAFGDGPHSRALFKQLNQITLRFDARGRVTDGAGDFLRDATAALIENDPDSGGRVLMPQEWPNITAAQESAILDAVASSLAAQRELVKPREGRFDDPARRYAIRAFIRVQREEDCPPELVWSPYSEPFTIAQWYESGDAAPVQITLPDLTDRKALKQLKPNVVFSVPENLQTILTRNTPKALASGEGSAGGQGSGMDWLCSFSIPIITLCAFIVLNIFLQLFDIIFRWMMFIKVCIPIPRSDSE